MVRIITGKRHSQVIPESSVYQIRLFFCLCQLQLLTTLQDLEDKLLILAALLAVQVLDMLDTRCLHRIKSKCLIGILD